jgi:hypothetical protein
VVMGVYSGWDCSLLKYGGEVFLDEVPSVWFLTKIWWWRQTDKHFSIHDPSQLDNITRNSRCYSCTNIKWHSSLTRKLPYEAPQYDHSCYNNTHWPSNVLKCKYGNSFISH